VKDTDLLAWIDIETTGLNHFKDELLEVACIITDQDLNELDRKNWVIKLSETMWIGVQDQMPDVVRKMHTESGLIKASKASNTPLHHWHDEMNEWLLHILHENPTYTKFVMAGSGVARFDYTWFQINFPMILDHFQYYCFDVGIIRRGLVMAGAIEHLENKSLVHRAMTDIEDHLEEWKYYISLIPVQYERAWVPNEWRTADDHNDPFGG